MLKRLLLLVIVLGVIFGGLYYLKTRQMAQSQAMLARPRPAAVIASADVLLELRQPMLRSVGSLVAVNGIDLASEVSGIVSEILFQSGDSIERGKPLLRLDATVDQAELNALHADLRLAEVEYRRSADLLPKKAVSRSDYDQAKAKYQSAQARIEEQEAVLARKTVRAPFSGLLGIRKVDLGQYLQPGEGIVLIQALDPIYVDYTLPEQTFRQLRIGQPVQLQIDAFPGERFSAEVSAIDAAIMQGSRSIRVRATLTNPDGSLRPGMFAEVHTLIGDARPVLTVPQTAISYNSYGDAVMLLVKDDQGQLTVQRRQIETGSVQAGRVEIVSGLERGDKVVRTGHNKLRPGQPVAVDNSVPLDDAQVTTP
ncbi:MAG: efflux RND transporter periplasmic adaptor subunit [Chromatiales bacterium]|jgi:membrane fusion protein (multidrug efflux system)